jgi:hypothetical protein
VYADFVVEGCECFISSYELVLTVCNAVCVAVPLQLLSQLHHHGDNLEDNDLAYRVKWDGEKMLWLDAFCHFLVAVKMLNLWYLLL